MKKAIRISAIVFASLWIAFMGFGFIAANYFGETSEELGFDHSSDFREHRTNLFEVQITMSPRIEQIRKVASNFELRYPDIETKTTYLAPNFILSVLDCESRMKVEQLKTKIQADFPNCEIGKCTADKD